jgi:hypothetical protein
MTVAKQFAKMVLQWRRLLKNVLCITAIDCCSINVTVGLSGVYYSDRLIFYAIKVLKGRVP